MSLTSQINGAFFSTKGSWRLAERMFEDLKTIFSAQQAVAISTGRRILAPLA